MSLPHRFLFILYYYPPAFGTAPARNYLIASEISRRVNFSRILTATPQVNTEKDIPEGIDYIKADDYRAYLRKQTSDGALPEQQKKSKAFQFVVKLINTFPVNILAGEGGLRYFYTLLRKGQRIIDEQEITHIYSSYRPFVDHYAAYRLKKRNPHIVWIADFRDLVIDPHYNHILLPGIQQSIFKRIFRNADMITTVSDGLAKRLREYHSNVVVVRNGIKDIPAQIQPFRNKFFRIAYTGSMFLDKRNAHPLFIVLKELLNEKKIDRDEIKITYAGKDGQIWRDIADQYGLESLLENKGIVSASEAAEIQRTACVNILLTVSSPQLQGVLTGKMIEYFASGSPVLGIVVNQNDPELDHLLQELEIGRSFSDQRADEQGIKQFLLDEYQHWNRTGFNRKPVNMEVLKEKYSVEVTMRPLWEHLK